MSTYIIQIDNIHIECDMEYGVSKDIVCKVVGVSHECLDDTIRKIGLEDYVKVEDNTLYILTSIFKTGKTPGEVIKEIAMLSRFC